MSYKLALNNDEIAEYIKDKHLLALDIETPPFTEYRNVPKSSLDAHKSTITSISFSVEKGTGIYVPF